LAAGSQAPVLAFDAGVGLAAENAAALSQGALVQEDAAFQLKDGTDAFADIGTTLDAQAGTVEAAGLKRGAVALAAAGVVFGEQVEFAVNSDAGVGAQR